MNSNSEEEEGGCDQIEVHELLLKSIRDDIHKLCWHSLNQLEKSMENVLSHTRSRIKKMEQDICIKAKPECGICSEKITHQACLTTCAHFFCAQCVIDMFCVGGANTCPLCRTQLDYKGAIMCTGIDRPVGEIFVDYYKSKCRTTCPANYIDKK